MSEQDRIMMLFSIIGRGKSKQYMEMLNSKNIRFHFQMTATGTAPSEMLDIFGLGSNAKDVVISLAPASSIRAFAGDFGKNLGASTEYGGLMMSLRLSAINRISAEIISKSNHGNTEKGKQNQMKSEHKQQLILITVNQGYTDQVMQTAKKAGAMGGTILRARLAGTERLEQFGEVEIQDEKEIISILAPVGVAEQIMNEVNREHGARSEAHGMVMSLPVEKAYKI